MKIRKIAFGLLLAAGVGLVFSCSKSDEAEDAQLTITFKAVYDGIPLVLNDGRYEYPDLQIISFSKLHLFLSELALTKVGGGDESLQDVIFLDFSESNKTLEEAEKGMEMTFDIAPGKYSALNLGLGVSPDLNAKIPGDYSNDHPLSKAGQYWTAWDSYIFSKTEGRYDEDMDGTPELGFVYHLGSDDLYRAVTFDWSSRRVLDLVEGDRSTLEVEIDFKKVLTRSQSDFLDIPAYPKFHSPQDIAEKVIGEYIADNYANSLLLSL